jgi:SAM-dependent methyltransferase
MLRKDDVKELTNLSAEELIKKIRSRSYLKSANLNEEYEVQSCFESLALMIKNLKGNRDVLSTRELLNKVFENMVEIFLNKNYPSLVRWNSLWIMRLSFDEEAEELYRMKFGQKIVETLDSSQYFHIAEETDVYFAALLFLIEFFLDDCFSEIIPKISEKIRLFCKHYPLSGFIIYSYLEHGPGRFSQFLQPILSCIDVEPSVKDEELRGLLPFDVASRAVHAIGALGDERDLNVLKDNGFLKICSQPYPKNRQLGSIERLTYYAEEEVHLRTRHSTQPSVSTSLAVYLRDLFKNKLPYLYHEDSRSLTIYANLYSNLRQRIEGIVPDSESQDRLFSTACLILSSINEKYFKDKSYSNQGKLKASLYMLDKELEKLHGCIESVYLVAEELGFEDKTVTYMREKVRSYLQEKPEDLINFSHVSFTLWAKGKKLGEPDIPQFSEYVKENFRKPIMKHVIKSNEDILRSIKGKWDIQKLSSINEINFLDIGAGVGNTTEAFLKHFPNRKKNIYAVELVPIFLKHYCRRIFMIITLECCINKARETNFEVTCINMDIHHFLEFLEKNKQTVAFANRNKLKTEAVEDMKIEGTFSIEPSATINHLKKICRREHHILCELDKIEKNQEMWQDIIRNYNKCLETYSDVLGERADSLQKELQRVREFFQEGAQNVNKQLDSLMAYTQSGKLNKDAIEDAMRVLHVCREKVQSLLNIPSPTKEACLEVDRSFDVIIANYVLHHLVKEYRQQIYKWLLDLSKEYAFFAISDPLLGISEFNRRYFNFTDEGVFASFSSMESCVKEVEEIENEEGFYWKEVDKDKLRDIGFYVVFQKSRRVQELEKDKIDIEELDTTISEITDAIKEHPELASDLKKLLENLSDIRVQLENLEKLEYDFKTGMITDADYRVERKKIGWAIQGLRNESNLLSIIHKIKNENEKSRLLPRIKEAIKSNKEFISVVVEIIKAILK